MLGSPCTRQAGAGRSRQAPLWSWRISERHVLQLENFGPGNRNPTLVGMCWDKGAVGMLCRLIAGDAKGWAGSVD